MSSKFLRSATALIVASTVAAAQGDDCTTATALAGGGTGVVQTTPINTAGFALAGPTASCNGLVDTFDGFYSFLATVSGTATFSTCNTSTIAPGGNAGGVDTYLAVYDGAGGCPITGVELGCNDDGGGCTGPSEVTVAVTAGNLYYVQVGDWAAGGAITGGTLAYVENAAGGVPANDQPSGATLVVGPGAYADSNFGSVVDGPLAICGLPTSDVWYYYIPTTTGIATLSTCPGSGGGAGNANGVANNDTVIGVWADGGGVPGAAAGCDDDACVTPAFASVFTLPVTSGVGLYVSVSAWNGGLGGSFVLEITESGGVLSTGDDCTVADTTAVGPGVYAYNSTGFLIAGPASGCSTGADVNDYWFAYTATQTGLAVVSNCPGSTAAPGGSAVGNTNTAISAWDGTACPPTTELICSDGAPQCGVAQSEVAFPVVSGTTYYLQVQGWAPGTAISGAIAIVETLPPVNDDCAGALPIAANVPVVASNGTATTSVPTSSCGIPTGDLWYSFTSPCSGSIVIETCGSGGFDTVVSAWDNCGGIELACNDDATTGDCAGTLMSYIELTGVAQGQTIYISVSGWNGGTGTFTLNVHCKYTHLWTTPAGPGSIQLENVDGPANSLAFSAVTLDLLHPGLPANQTFPNGWFFGVPMGFPELFQQITWPGGLPFTGILDPAGYLFNFVLPGGTTSGLAGLATIWSVGVAFDPLTGFATVSDATDPTAFPL
jgi:hypothetical protein